MLRPRIIPCLLVHRNGLVKTVEFDAPKYVGDPLNAVRIFNEKEVDELFIADIDATVERREPNYDSIRQWAFECRMPLAYAGGVRTVDQVERIVSLGVEKVVIGSAAITDPKLINTASVRVGSQSVVVVIDARRAGVARAAEVYHQRGRLKTGLAAAEFAKRMQDEGAGEIIIQCIDRDGRMNGYDQELIQEVRSAVDIPLTALGGASSLDDMRSVVQRNGPIGVAAGSLFVFKGKYRAVLISYPTKQEKISIQA